MYGQDPGREALKGHTYHPLEKHNSKQCVT